MIEACETNERMSQLRGLLYQSPSDGAWRELCRLLYTWPSGEGLEVAIEYCGSLLERWPDAQRRALGSWWRALDDERYAMLWPLVRSFQIWYGDLGDAGAARLATCPLMAHLTHLDLSVNGITDEGAIELSMSPFLGRLTHLDLSVNEIGDGACIELLVAPGLPSLEHLNLQKNRISELGASLLAESPQLARLGSLRMAGNPTGPGGAEALERSVYLAPGARQGLFEKV